ncbi:hypothetical protein SANTM175S_05531 [Streptomyces antimycoticus]
MDWLTRFAATVRSVEPELTALDQKAGDGDFGGNLVTGMDGVRRALDALAAGAGNGERNRRGPDVPLDAAARVFLDDVGGTSGPLFGLLFQELADALGMAAARPGTAALALGTAAGAAAIQRVGEAEVGDKTMVDALVPAARALASCEPTADPRMRSIKQDGGGPWAAPRPICAPGAGVPAIPATTPAASRIRAPWPSPCCSRPHTPS